MSTKMEFFIGISALMTFFQISRPTALKLVKGGEIPAIRVGGQYRIPVSGIETYLTEQGLDRDTVRQIVAGGGVAPTSAPHCQAELTPVEEASR